MERQVIYVALGPAHIKHCKASIESLRAAGKYSGQIIVISDEEDWQGVELVQVPPISFVTHLESRNYKTRLPHYAKGKLVVFLDADTIVRAPIDELFNQLGAENIAMALGPFPTIGSYDGKFAKERTKELIARTGPDFPRHNSGVILFKNAPEIRALFDRWNFLWNYHGRFGDELPLCHALFESKTPVKLLDQKFNSVKGAVIDHQMNQLKLVKFGKL